MYTVLVVDDEAEIRDLIAFTMGRQGYAVTSTGDPLEALSLASNTAFDLALLDWSMPQMDGGELTARLREIPAMREVAIVIVTARADAATRDLALTAGATRLLTKPFSLRQLTDLAAELLLSQSQRLTASADSPGVRGSDTMNSDPAPG